MMRTNLTIASAVLAAVALSACGRDSDEPNLVERAVEEATEGTEATEPAAGPDPAACSELYAAGRPTADVIADSEASGLCERAPGDFLIAAHMSWDCPDGRTVHVASDEWGWGFSDDAWQVGVPEPYADCVLPGTDGQHP
jgi:hypothetical protein